MFEYIDKYCERVSTSLWDEPLNIVSNLAYLLAAILLSRAYWHRLNQVNSAVTLNKPWDILGLIALMFVISLGSSLWHIYAQKWSLYADAVPILLFINLYIICCLYRIVQCSIYQMIGLFAFFHALNYGLQQYFDKDFLNGSIFYLPTWLFLTGIGFILMRSQKGLSQHFVKISVIFAFALVFRTIDLTVCGSFSYGTHFIWHLISAYMMYLLVRALMMQHQMEQQLLSGNCKIP